MDNVTQIIWKDISKKIEIEQLIEKVIRKCFEVEHINTISFYVCITLTNEKKIKELNNKYRSINKPTDVLSFPIFEKQELNKLITQNKFEEILIQDILGDIIICISKVEEQASEYGHSFERELAYMVVHGFYHLLGYDHITDQEKEKMRIKEENVLEKLNITR